MTSCEICSKKGIISPSYTNLAYCRKHFLQILERRIKKNIRNKDMIKPYDEIAIARPNTTEGKIAKYFLKSIQKRLPFTLQKSAKKTIVPMTLDAEETAFFRDMMGIEKSKRHINILDSLLAEEIGIVAKILKIPVKKPKSDVIREELDRLEKRYKGLKFSTAKGIEFYKKITE